LVIVPFLPKKNFDVNRFFFGYLEGLRMNLKMEYRGEERPLLKENGTDWKEKHIF